MKHWFFGNKLDMTENFSQIVETLIIKLINYKVAKSGEFLIES